MITNDFEYLFICILTTACIFFSEGSVQVFFYQIFIGLVALSLQVYIFLYFSQSVAHMHCVVSLMVFKTVLIFLSTFSLLLVFSSSTMIFWCVVFFGFIFIGVYRNSKSVFLHKTYKMAIFLQIYFFCLIFIFLAYWSPITCQSIWYFSIGPWGSVLSSTSFLPV